MAAQKPRLTPSSSVVLKRLNQSILKVYHHHTLFILEKVPEMPYIGFFTSGGKAHVQDNAWDQVGKIEGRRHEAQAHWVQAVKGRAVIHPHPIKVSKVGYLRRPA